ncbi:MAG: tetratricopeptide repeat protein [Chloroflexota bacterium]
MGELSESASRLPTGTVTFLFTDIEGSTARWEHQRAPMSTALARHDALVRRAVDQHGGHVVKTMGDAFHAAFSRAPDALACALDAQRWLQAETWGEVGPLRVRMVLHTGAADERDGDYYGPPLNRAARLLVSAHGGQILLSAVTAGLVRDVLDDGLSFLDLGEHRLKDLIHPEHIFQLVAPDLPAEFPPLVTLDHHAHNLPIQPTALIGREREVGAISALLNRDDIRLVTLTGPGGTGKTRVSLQVAAEVIDRFADGVYFVELAPIANPDLAPAAIAHALDIRDVGGRPVLDIVIDYLRHRRVLLVLDNFEQLLPAAPVVSRLLEASTGLKVLVTSRAPLQLRGEHERQVPPLALPDRQHPPSASALSLFGAVALFIERAVAIKPDFAVTNDNAPAVAEICHRLDGLPLAIELAAARVRLLTPQAMLARLEHRLPLLTGGARDLPVRQQTLRGAIAWSYDLLGAGEQRLFRRLAVFVGGFDLEAVEAVCNVGGDLEPDPSGGSGQAVLDGMASLVAKSLVRQWDEQDGEARFGMFETIREFASEQLESSGELAEIRDRHLAHYLSFAETVKPRLQGPQQATWFDNLERDNDNLRAALEWSYAEHDADPSVGAPRVDAGIRLAAALGFFWVLRGRGRENLPRIRGLLALASPGTVARARALTVAAHVQGHMLGDHQGAIPLADEALAAWRILGDPQGTAVALVRRGQIAFETGDYPLAATLLTEARALFRVLGGASGPEVPTAGWLAEVAQAQGDHVGAEQLWDEVLVEARAAGDGHAVAHSLRERARLRRSQGDSEQALVLLRESISLHVPLKDIRCACIILDDLAGLLCKNGPPADVARLFGAAEALRELIGRPLTRAYQATRDQDIATLKRRLDSVPLAEAWSSGRTMTLVESIAYAVEVSA